MATPGWVAKGEGGGAAGRGRSAAFFAGKKRWPGPTDRALPEPANAWVGGIVGQHSDEDEK